MKKILRFRFFILSFSGIFSSFISNGQQNEWTWMKGDNVPNQPGNFGTMGIPSQTNKPGARYEACQWTDQQGNFWLYGGGIVNTRYSDLWRFEPATNNWTWMSGSAALNQQPVYGTKGIADPANTPGGNGFGAATWTDLNNNLWMYGGEDGVNGSRSTLWKYQIFTNEWTWMYGDTVAYEPPLYGTHGVSGPGNTPGGRCETSCTWVDNNGNLWLFGGTPAGPGASCNDLWKYTISTNEWTWMSGDTVPNMTGVYGTKGVPDPANKPGGRWCYTSWKDTAGNLWLFGGIEASSPVGMSFFNDLWKYDIAIDQWTWMSGSNMMNMQGSYGVKCTPSPFNSPGGRGETRSCWQDDCNSFWLLGGRDLNFDLYNDLWRYDLALNQWTWVSGANVPNQPGVFGTILVPSPTDIPGARMGAVSWKNSNGFWLFGGYDFGGNQWNDLWKFAAQDSSCGLCNIPPVALFTAPHHICPGTCTDFTNLSQNANSYQWFFSGAVPATSTDVNPQNICYNTPGSYDVSLIASNAIGSDSITLPNYMVVYPYSPPQSIIQNGDTLISNTGFVSYQWFYDGDTIPGATDYWYVATQSGDYSVVCIDDNGCSVEAVVLNVVASIHPDSYRDTVDNQQPILVYPNPVGDEFTIHNSRFTINTAASISIYNVFGETVFSAVDCLLSTVYCGLLPSGMYFLEINMDGKLFRAKFVKR